MLLPASFENGGKRLYVSRVVREAYSSEPVKGCARGGARPGEGHSLIFHGYDHPATHASASVSKPDPRALLAQPRLPLTIRLAQYLTP
jgi:hypothetical protein